MLLRAKNGLAVTASSKYRQPSKQLVSTACGISTYQHPAACLLTPSLAITCKTRKYYHFYM